MIAQLDFIFHRFLRLAHGDLLCNLCFFLTISSPLLAQTEVTPFRPGVTTEGVCYFLPKTVFEVVVTAEKAVTKPGEFAAYSDRYLRQPNVPTAESTEWTIKEITLMPYGVPDSTKAYSIKLRSQTSAPLVSLTDEGLLLSINKREEQETVPELPKGIPAPKEVNGRDFMTQEILAAGSSAKMAQLTAEFIYELRDSRNALIRGEADNTPKDGMQLKLMLDNLDKEIEALESLFKGQTLTSTEVMSFDYEPSADASLLGKQQLLCRFSRRLGLVDADDLSGEPIWIIIKALGTIPQAAPEPEPTKKGLFGMGKSKTEQGVYVNVPQRAQVTISSPRATLLTKDVSICQLGVTELLSDVLFNKKMETRVTLHQHTGNVKEIE